MIRNETTSLRRCFNEIESSSCSCSDGKLLPTRRCSDASTCSSTKESISTGSCSGETKKRPRRYPSGRRAVTFKSVEIFEFPQQLGDNPGVSAGAPLCLARHHTSHSQIDLSHYEYLRLKGGKRRSLKELQESAEVRHNYLLSVGYTDGDIKNAAERARCVRQQRQAFHLGKGWDKVHILLESLAIKSQMKKKRQTSKLLKQQRAGLKVSPAASAVLAA